MNTLRFSTIRIAAATLLAGIGLFSAVLANADSGSTISTASSSASSEDTILTPQTGSGINIMPGEGAIIVEQKNESGAGILGKWTLIKPDNHQVQSGEPSTNISATSAGKYTLIASLPKGATATIRIYRNGKMETLEQRPQVSFILWNNDQVRVVIHYTIVRVGLISVDSDPQGMEFRMNGPNSTHYSGVTPMSYPSMTEGQYQVIYQSLKGCAIPASKSLLLQAGSRVSFTVRISCATADNMRARQAEEAKGDGTYIMIGTFEDNATARDVPQNAWFAPYVANVSKYGILSGYRDDDGKLTGEFGPGNSVTVAELAKAAHKIAGISEDAFLKTNPENPRALGAWFSPFIASAESRGWTIFNDAGINPARNATRGEVLVTLLQALDIKLNWQKGSLFTDVTMRTPYAAAIETAAAAKVVEGQSDGDDASMNTFGPTDNINRAEFAKILSKMIDTYKSTSSSSSSKR